MKDNDLAYGLFLSILKADFSSVVRCFQPNWHTETILKFQQGFAFPIISIKEKPSTLWVEAGSGHSGHIPDAHVNTAFVFWEIKALPAQTAALKIKAPLTVTGTPYNHMLRESSSFASQIMPKFVHDFPRPAASLPIQLPFPSFPL